jgi:hypothetical protein
VEVLIRLEGTEPPTGTVLLIAAEDRPYEYLVALPFIGWLGLLRVLAMLVGKDGARDR